MQCKSWHCLFTYIRLSTAYENKENDDNLELKLLLLRSEFSFPKSPKKLKFLKSDVGFAKKRDGK